MTHLSVEDVDSLRLIRMRRPKANAIHPPMLEELMQAFRQARDSTSVRAVVLGSEVPRFFSGGFDVHEVFGYGAGQIRDFFGKFMELYQTILRLPKPVVGALNGHAMAGGAVLALACDVRVMTKGDYVFSLNEVDLGIVLSPGVHQMASRAAGEACAREMILEGQRISPFRGSVTGLFQELVEEAELDEKAVARARRLAAKPPRTFAAIKEALLDKVVTLDQDRQSLDDFVQRWTSEESVACRRQVAASLRK